ncbi:MAG: hypothetical protein AAF230_00210 [Pseudomonadota bacterium]
MFKIEKEPKFWATVTVVTPTDDGGREDTFKARFKVRPATVVEAVDALSGGSSLPVFLKDTIVDLAEITDEDGNDLAFEDGLVDQLLDHFGARTALWNTYIAEVTRARLGN